MVINTILIIEAIFFVVGLALFGFTFLKLTKGIGELVTVSTEVEKTTFKARKLTVQLIKESEKYTTPKGIIKEIGKVVIEWALFKYFNPFKK